LAGAKVLLVEDNEINQELASELLAGAGVVVTIANHGEEALEILERETFDGVLMDCQMPVMDGYDATRAIRAQDQFKTLPVIAMTANVMSGDRDKVLEAGMNDLIGKPINVGDMFTTMAKWITPSEPLAEPSAEAQPEGVTTPDEAIPELPGIDTRIGLATTLNNLKLYRKLLGKFRDSQGDFDTQFRSAQQDADPEAATRCAHTLKGVAGSIGAEAVQETASALEAACIEERASLEIDPLLEQVCAALAPVIAGLDVLSQPVAETAEGREFDLAIVKPMLAQLRELLERDDADAQNVLDELEPLIAGTLHAGSFKRLGDSLGSYDFGEALEILGELERNLAES
jgi:two-component system sensor histidine kinase/response regulator